MVGLEGWSGAWNAKLSERKPVLRSFSQGKETRTRILQKGLKDAVQTFEPASDAEKQEVLTDADRLNGITRRYRARLGLATSGSVR